MANKIYRITSKIINMIKTRTNKVKCTRCYNTHFIITQNANRELYIMCTNCRTKKQTNDVNYNLYKELEQEIEMLKSFELTEELKFILNIDTP